MFAQLGDIKFELITYFNGWDETVSYNYVHSFLSCLCLKFTSEDCRIIPIFQRAELPEKPYEQNYGKDECKKIRNRETHPYTFASKIHRKQIKEGKQNQNLSRQ